MISTNENLLLWEQRINKRNKSDMTVKNHMKRIESVNISIIIGITK